LTNGGLVLGVNPFHPPARLFSGIRRLKYSTSGHT
jgi:hypothetical protein